MNILVTGGASGLGESITKALAKNDNDRIYFTYNRSIANAEAIEKEFPNTKGFPCNFEDPQSVEQLLEKMDQFNLQILINNAMTGFEKNHFHKLSSDSFSAGFQKNILPVIQLTQKAILIFRKQKFGKIITVLSSAIINKPPIGWSEYVAQKNYLLSLSKSWAVENAKFNIVSNCVSPSFMKTALTSDTDERIVEELQKNHPLKSLLSTVEVAESIAFLAHAPQHINGTNSVLNAAEDIY
jgi:3-oxoacyl-[acyl-carrier protein] reductase